MSKAVERSKTILLIDVAHNSVGAGVLVVHPGSTPKLLSVWRETFNHADPSHERMLASTVRIMRKLIEKANASGYAAWDDIYCCIGSPWVLTHVRTASYVNAKQFAVTEKLLNSIADTDMQRFKERLGNDLLPFSEHAMMLDHKRLTVRVNGHAMKQPVGQRARSLECTYLVSGINPDVAAAFRSAVYAVTHREPVLHAVQYAQLQAVKLLPGADNFVLFDFHGGIGECTVVRDNVLTVTATSPISEESYLADLAKNIGKDIRETIALLGMRSQNMIDHSIADRINEADRQIFDAYIFNFRNMLVAAAEHGLLPNQVFYITDHGEIFFKKLLSAHDYAPLSLLHNPLKPILISRQLFNNRIDDHAVRKHDTAILLAALAYTSNN